MWVSVRPPTVRDGADMCSQVPYPLIALVNRMPQTIQGRSPLTFRTRTFETFTLSFKYDKDAVDVFDSVKDLTVASTCTRLVVP